MSGKSLFPTEGALPGIAPTAPFVVDHATFVAQVTAPFLFTQRLALIRDTVQSLIAVGVLAAPHTFVMGEGATDSAFGDRSVLIGYNVMQNPGTVAGAAVDQVLIGNSITIAALGINGAGSILIGAGAGITVFAAAPSVGSNVIIGRNAIATGINAVSGDPENNVLIGDGATSTGGGNTVVGSGASNVGSQGTAIGQQAGTGAVCVAVGYKAGGSGAVTDVTIGGNAKAGSALCTAVGSGANNSGAHGSIALGANANTNGKTGTIMLGTNANVAADNWCQIGGDATYFISTICFGRGNAQGAGGQTYTLTTTDTLNANVDGNTLQIQPGAGTGSSANAGNRGLDLQAGILGGAGSTPQVYTSCLAIRHSDLNIALWGGLTAPFSGGKAVLFIKNATTNPTVAAVAGGGILSVQGGNLHFLNAAGVDTALTPGGAGGVTTGGLTVGVFPYASGASAISDSFIMGGAATNFQPTVDTARALGGIGNRWGGLYVNGIPFGITYDNASFGVGAKVLTLTNGPISGSGNPTKYLVFTCDGVTGVIPWWPV